ncbi:MAG: hypothetical protein Q9199_004883 [Rusavskia elegans]
MNIVCPGSWRALCKGLGPPSQPLFVSWTAAIGKIPKPSQQQIRSFYPPNQIWPAATKCPVAQSAHESPTRILSGSANFSTQSRKRDAAANSPNVRGLTKPKKFSKDEIVSVFGKHMHHAEGNQLLHFIQEQRLAGTIDQDIPAPPGQKQKALAWLRKTYPVDEEQAIIARLEREEQAALRPQEQQSDSVYGDPVIDQIKRRNLATQAKENAEKAKAEAEAQLDLPVSATKAMAEREERRSMDRLWVERYKKKAEEAGLSSVPQISFFRRVGPATITAFSVIFCCVMFALTYMPPPRAARLFPNISMAAATVGALIGINCIVWLAWRWPPLWAFMNRVFILVPAYPYATSVVANLFSHQHLSHLAANMAVLWFVGTKLHEDIGRGPFLALYIACGVAASQFLLIYTVICKNWGLASLGCSGAVSALLATWLYINKEKGVRIWPFPPAATEAIQPLFVLGSLVAFDLIRLRRGSPLIKYMPGTDAKIDHVSHLAGFGSGIVAAQFLRLEPRGRQQKKVGQQVEKANPSKE